ncbi:MAG: Beta-galactosidase C-terminal domain, partial [Propionibacteriaceae bacterium]|nr:Beta-galactosidase C-terminal domain [Propionibacteriaceae bacterium]
AATCRHVPARDGDGQAWYLGTLPDEATLDGLLLAAIARHGLCDPAAPAAPGVEHTVRLAPDGRTVHFVLNHGDADVEVPGPVNGQDLLTGRQVRRGAPLALDAHGVCVIEAD